MIWNLLTLLSCLLMILLFRRLDRSNLRMTKLKRYSSRIFNDFKKLTDTESRKYNDATIEMNILIKKANQQITTLKESINDLEDKLDSLDNEKTIVQKTEEDLKLISHAAKDVNKQIEFIAASRASFSEMEKKIQPLSNNISQLERDANSIIHAFNEKVRERSRELSEEMAIQLHEIRESVNIEESKIIKEANANLDLLSKNFSKSLSNMEQNIAETQDSIMEEIDTRVNTAVKSVDKLENRIESTEQRVISDLNTKISKLEKTISEVEKIENNIDKMSSDQRDVEKA